MEGLKRSLLEAKGGLRRGAKLCLVMPRSLEELLPDVHALRISSCLTLSCKNSLVMGQHFWHDNPMRKDELSQNRPARTPR